MAYANPAKINEELGWHAEVTELAEIIGSAWSWMMKHPHGYPK